jgi:hypothetical protein
VPMTLSPLELNRDVKQSLVASTRRLRNRRYWIHNREETGQIHENKKNKFSPHTLIYTTVTIQRRTHDTNNKNFFHDIQIIYAVRLDPLRLSPMFFLDSKEQPVYDVIRLLLSYHLIMRATSPKILSLFFFALLSQFDFGSLVQGSDALHVLLHSVSKQHPPD